MLQPYDRRVLPQFSLLNLLEIIAGCSLVFAAFTYRNLFLEWFAFAFLTVWAVRVRDLPLRWSLMSCFGGCAAVFFGLMCLQVAFAERPIHDLSTYITRETYLEYLAFLGPLVSGCGIGFALLGFALTLRCLIGRSVERTQEMG